MSGDRDDAAWMRQALALAARAATAGEVPVGCVVVRDGVVIGKGFNAPISSHDPTAHAEVAALRDAACAAGNYRLPDAELYVTVEPCLMCAGALVHARIRRVVFGAYEPRTGAVCSIARALDTPGLNHRVEATGGVLEAQCARLLKDFFKARRGSV